ncbi:Leucine-rich repeat domain, L domain-like [Phytophthora cactorum]|nr:Leucine-rich repeat domain, L domain-like [Phytophthora cactorum]
MAGKLHVTKAQALAEGEKRPLLKDIHVSVNRHDPTSSALSGLGDRYPSQDATCISSALFSWVTPLMELGNQRPLEHDDLYLLDPVNRAHEVSTEFQEAWKKQCSKPSGKPSLSWALASCFGGQIAKAGLLKLVHDSLQFVGPMLIKEIIAYLQNPDAPLSEGLIYAGIVFVSGVMQSFLLRNYFFHCFEAGMRVRSAVCTAVYTKSLVLSAAARQKKTTGEITNLMSIDAQRLQELSTYINSVWFSIFQIVVACYLLWKQIGPATFAGVAVIILMLPVTAGISKLMRRLQLKLMGVKDERIKICNEVLAGMKVIKLQAWEHSFTKRVLEYRSEELSKLRTYIYARSGSMTLFSAIPSFVTVASFYTYVKLGNTLDVGTALTSLALFNILRFPLFMLPQVLNSIVEATVSIDRLSSYFQEEEREKVGPGDLDGVGVRVNNADFMWDTAPRASSASEASKEEDSLLQEDSILDKEALGGGDSLPVLQCVSVEARPGDLIAVVGHVGAGKSTLLSGILGDARCSRGDVSLRGSVAYVSQQPFIQNATVRENICFGLPFNEAKYAEALRVSSMQKDLAVLPGGDMTEIGEKGINLSGGQRTRVALARAVYQDADIYLLDDILSAVDSHVGHDIFKECIKTCLKDKLVILVTHGLTFLSECDNIVVLENGVIRENGTYEDLMEKDGGLLMDLVAKYKDQDEQEPHTIEDDISVDELEEVEEDNPTPERLDRRLSRSSVRSERSLSEAVVIFIFIATQCVNLLSTWWLSFWSEHSQPKDGPANKESEMFYVYIYMALNLVYAVALYIRAITTYKGVCEQCIGDSGDYLRYFIKSSRELQRLDSISRSPVFALLSETLDGLPTIRAYRAETQFSTKNEELIDRNQRAYFLNFAVNCWLALRLEFAGTLIAAFAALTAVLAHSSDPERGAAFAGLAGVSLTYAFSVTQSLNWCWQVEPRVALMRLVELDSGSIVIDGLDISTIGLHELRNKISIIPQDPVLFSGTVRSNVDPFDHTRTSRSGRHCAEVTSRTWCRRWIVLWTRRARTSASVSVSCIARALLKRSRIILMDEATASIDTETDRKIQRSIREEFRDCTCLTIAHRINTILDADRILVMERGAVGEFDTPKALQKKQDGFSRRSWSTGRTKLALIATELKGYLLGSPQPRWNFSLFAPVRHGLLSCVQHRGNSRDLRGSHVDLEIMTRSVEALQPIYNAIGEMGSTALAKALETNSHLRVLDLMHNRIGKNGITPWLGDTMRVNYALRELKLSHNAIGDKKAVDLLQSLSPKPLTEEEKLKARLANRRHTTMSDGSAEPHEDSEPFNSTLKTLLLSNTGISDEASTHLAHMLSHTRSLTHLDISCNDFTSEGNVNIACGLQRNASIRYLNYRENKLTRWLRWQYCVLLSHCPLEPPGVVELYYALAENTSLRTSICLQRNHLAGVQAASRWRCRSKRDGSPIVMSLEGNSGEKCPTGTIITGGMRPVKPPLLV